MFRIPKYYDDFHGLWRSTLSALDCIYVLKGLKRCSIDFVEGAQIPELRNFCKLNNLCFELSDYKILSRGEKAKGGFSNLSSRLPVDSPQGHFASFIAKDRMDAQLAKYYYAGSDHTKLGPLLGYPKCCSEFFLEHFKQASEKNMDFILYALFDIRQYDFYNNRAMRYFDISLISHFPCSLDCQASQAIAKERLLFVRKEHPEIAAFFEKYLRSMVIYTESQGVFFSNDYSINQNHVEYKTLYGTIDNDLFQKLKNVGTITVESYNKLVIGSELLDGDCGILLFK